MTNSENFYDTIIIGAGISGVSTAYHLLVKNNYKGRVLILEAKDRYGGRISDKIIAGKNVELGANWIHGIINNPIYDLAVKFGLVDLIKNEPEENLYNSGNVCGFTDKGEKVALNTINQAYQTYFWMLKKCENYYQRMSKGEFLKEETVGHVIDNEVNNFLSTKNEKERPLLKALFKQMINRETDINGCHTLEDLSLRYYGSYEELPGGNLIIAPGFKKIVAGLLQEIKKALIQKNLEENNFDLLLKHEVIKVSWHGVESNNKQPIEVTCKNGKIFKCHHIVNTMPVGVLQNKIEVLYEPKVPQYKIDCVKSIGFDCLNKIYLEYENPLCPEFFDSSIDEIMVFWMEEDEETSIEKNWFKKIYSFTKVSSKILLAWVSGKEATYAETLSNEVISHTLTKQLRLIFNNDKFPSPISVYQTNWGSDEHFCGAYSFIKFNESTKNIEMLGQPIYSDPGSDKPVLLFAGEACHNKYFSTTHGAFLSGKKTSSYLLD